MKRDEFRGYRESEEFKYYQSLGYDDRIALVFCLLDFTRDTMLNLCDQYQKENNSELSFVDFVLKNYTEAPVGYSDYRPKAASPQSMSRSTGLFQSVRETAHNLFQGSAMASPMMVRKSSEKARGNPVTEKAYVVMDCESVSSVSMEEIRTDSYEPIEEKGERDVISSPTATFRPTYNTASAGILLNNIRRRFDIQRSMVRTEELLNYLSYDLTKPEEGWPFALTSELKTDKDKTYLFLGVQGKKVLPSRQNICLLLDISGSMSTKCHQMVMTIATLLSKLKDGDIFSLVTYSTDDDVILNGFPITSDPKCLDDILRMLAGIHIYGMTNGSAGLNKAYEIIEKNKIKDGVNRVIILTDGDLNFGIHDKDGLIGLISKKKETGAYFSAIGMGLDNLMDDKLEVLAKNGNGNYFVVNELPDVDRSINKNYEALVYPIAKNVKAQVEFNPKKIKTWKLVGYENRMLNHEDFRDDKVIAEPFGSGSYFVALFEITLNDSGDIQSNLKYQTIKSVESDELATLSIRFENIESGTAEEMSFPIMGPCAPTTNIEKAIACARIAEKLRSGNVDELTRQKTIKLLQ